MDTSYPFFIGKLSKLMVYDRFSRLGDRIPLWGDEDTLTEYSGNWFSDTANHPNFYLKS